VFAWLARTAGIEEHEMLRTFNCGVGLVAVVSAKNAGHVIDAFQESGERAFRIGTLIKGDGAAKVRYRGAMKL
jgi:phosphoribosylformylglycinamidine cyclo-ligase